MGCCASRKETELKVEESILNPFELTLGLHKIQYDKPYTYCLNLSEKGYISYLELSKMFSEFSLAFQDIFEFYDQFDRSKSRIVTQKRFSYLQLQSLFLLLCKGDTKSKIKSWFKLYDDGKKVLSVTRVEEMLQNFIKVSVDYICSFQAKYHSDNQELHKYDKLVKIGSDILLEELSKKLTNNKSVVGEDEFVINSLKCFRNDLLAPAALRDRSYYLGLNGSSTLRPDSPAQTKKRPPALSFDDLSDVSFVFEKEELQVKSAKHSRTGSSQSIFLSEDSTKNQRENLRYLKDSRKFSILEIANDGDNQETGQSPSEIKRRSKREKDLQNNNANLLIPIGPGGGKVNMRRASHNFDPSMLNVNQLTVNTNEGKFGKRFSIVVTSSEI